MAATQAKVIRFVRKNSRVLLILKSLSIVSAGKGRVAVLEGAWDYLRKKLDLRLSATGQHYREYTSLIRLANNFDVPPVQFGNTAANG